MKKILFILVASLSLAGCVSHNFKGGEIKSVSDVNFATTRFKRGRACANYLFPVNLPMVGFVGLPLGGEDRALTAIQNGRINTVEFAEERTENYIVFGRRCIDVYGQ